MIANMQKLLAIVGAALIMAACSGTAEVATSRPLTATLELRLDADSMDLSPITWIAVAPDGNIAVA